MHSVLAASAQRNVGLVLAVVVTVGFLFYLFINARQAKPEVGSEIELASNRKPYLDDEDLEGTKLDRSLKLALFTLGISAIGLPLYWLNEPARQENAESGFQRTFVSRGEASYEERCSNCHGPGATGGVASYTLTDSSGGFIAQVEWTAPALNTALLRYTREEVEFVLNFGRPFSPMPAWGTPGGGPLTTQQVQNLVDYLEDITPTPEEAQAQATEALALDLGVDPDDIDYDDPAVGAALFNLQVAGGSYSCARCHTQGWSYRNTDGIDPGLVDFGDGTGAFGPNLSNGTTLRQFESPEQHAAFIFEGSEEGQRYGVNGQGRGYMPGFGSMLTEDMIAAIVAYERSL